jgi:acetolactate synthase I/II/III large subunit
VQIPAVLLPPIPSNEKIALAAAMLKSGRRTGLVITGNALYDKALKSVGHIAAATSADLFTPYPFTRIERGAGAPTGERIPYVLEQATE